MKNAKIFLVGKNENELIPMNETPYEKEDVLQVLLERYPDLLPGDQINPENPVQWLLVKREIGVPGELKGSDVWSLDHLFLDQEGIPTFVECKRAPDTRNRREVVAQMLDYAANGTEYWAIDKLRQDAAETAKGRNKSLDEEVQRLLEGKDDADIEVYWQKVERNLRDGKVRIIFVADETPRELRRLVEFLNEKMTDVEVIAVEVKQYLGDGDQKAIVPRVIGLTEAARLAKSKNRGSKKPTNREEFLAKCNVQAKEFFKDILKEAEQQGKHIYWGVVGFSIRTSLSQSEGLFTFAYGWPADQFDIYLGYLPFSPEEEATLRKELLSYGVFREAGQKTLKANVSDETVDQLKKAFSFILEKVNEFAKSH